jgi:uncharacterized protein with HEPN domain
LSEASRRLPNEYKEREAQISLRAIAGIGNVLRHDYHQTYPTVLHLKCHIKRIIRQAWTLSYWLPGRMRTADQRIDSPSLYH